MNRRDLLKYSILSPLAVLLPKIKAQGTSDAVEILHERYGGSDRCDHLLKAMKEYNKAMKEYNQVAKDNTWKELWQEAADFVAPGEDNTWIWFQASCLS